MFPTEDRGRKAVNRSIIHLDLDAFYASVEQMDDPELRGRPVVVGGTGGRGVVSAASYEARRYGIHSAMPMSRAVRQCPQAVVLPVRMRRYAGLSREIFRIYHEYTPLVEPLSLDEAFLDVTASTALFGFAESIAREIRRRVLSETGLTVSAGVAPNKFLAKVASDLKKPDALVVVQTGEIQAFLDPLPVSKIWGVGRVTGRKLEEIGVRTIADLRRMPEKNLARLFHSAGGQLARLARGVDERPVIPAEPVKSVGNEETYGDDLHDLEEITIKLQALSGRVGRRLRQKEVRGRTVTVKVRTNDFRTITRSRTLETATDDTGTIYRISKELVRKTPAGRRPVRLLGVTVSGLDPVGISRQESLFADSSLQKTAGLDRTLDELARRFGSETVLPSLLLADKRRRKR